MKDCIFCKIVSRDFDSARIWEDKKFLAILDVNPNTRGMTLVLPKKHHDSYVVDMPDTEYGEYFSVVKKIAKMLERALKVKRVALVMEGLGVNHAHIKLYPLHGLTEKFQEIWSNERIFFENYQGYVTTQLGPQQDLSELKKLAETIRKNS